MSKTLNKKDCISLLADKAEALGRFPKKSDFTTEEVTAIKAHLGPWPRALEAAGVKEVNRERIEKQREKRRRARENQKRYKESHSISHKEENKNG